MAYDFDVEGWEDFDGNRHEGKPSNIDDVEGELVHARDPGSGDEHWFWAFTYMPFGDWEEWLDYIGSLMEMYGMELA